MMGRGKVCVEASRFVGGRGWGGGRQNDRDETDGWGSRWDNEGRGGGRVDCGGGERRERGISVEEESESSEMVTQGGGRREGFGGSGRRGVRIHGGESERGRWGVGLGDEVVVGLEEVLVVIVSGLTPGEFLAATRD